MPIKVLDAINYSISSYVSTLRTLNIPHWIVDGRFLWEKDPSLEQDGKEWFWAIPKE